MGYRDAVFVFSFAKLIVCIYKYGENSVKSFCCSKETSASTSQSGNVVSKVGIGTFYDVSIAFVSDIAVVESGENYIHITLKSICVVTLCRQCAVNNFLKVL